MTSPNNIAFGSYSEVWSVVREYLLGVGPVKGPRESTKGAQYQACCPFHGDADPSLSILVSESEGIYFRCFKECLPQRELFTKMAEWVGLPKRAFGASSSSWVSLDGLAEAKKLPTTFLAGLGVREVVGSLHIPYWMEKGASTRTRIRKSLDGGFLWSSMGNEADRPVAPYGLWLLPRWRPGGVLYFVEGESDCWTAWLHNIPAIGFPGKGTPSHLLREYAPMLDGISTIFVIEESDDYQSQTFLKAVRAGLTRAGYPGRLYSMRLPAKDLSELYTKNTETFMDNFTNAMETAMDIATWPEVSAIPTHPLAVKLYTIISTTEGDVITAFDARRRLRGKTAKDVGEALAVLEGAGVLRKLPQDRKPGRPSYTYRINPRIKAA